VAVARGSTVLCRWTLTNDAGEVVSDGGETLRGHVHGVTRVWPELEAALDDAEPGRTLEFTVERPFGEVDPALHRSVLRGSWPAHVPAVVGPFVFPVDGTSEPARGRIVAVDADDVHVDQNHPLAGQRLRFAVEVVRLRESTEAERRFGHPLQFPSDLVHHREVEDAALRSVAPLCMVPPYPWGQLVYRRLLEGLEGDVIELGVGLGGTSLYFGECVRGTGRRVWACDTFAGLPEPDVERDNPYFLAGLYDGETPLLDRFRAQVSERGLDEVVLPIPGAFADTLGAIPSTRYALAHLDSDLYASVRTSLEHVWDRLVDGGVLVVDDFLHPSQGVARACADFFNARGLRPVWQVVFPYSVYCVKGAPMRPRGLRAVDGNTYSFDAMRADPAFLAEVAAAVDRAWPDSRPAHRARALLALLEQSGDQTDDLYAYLWAMADFFTGIAGGFHDAQRI
jgi:FKBP-type peptidyl-prolyl cis-trans isomerase 2